MSVMAHISSAALVAVLSIGGAVTTDDGTGPVELDPGTIALCNAGFGDVSVKSYEAPVLEHIDLLCGDDASGYVHIRKNHEEAWQTMVDSVGGGTWDDFMEYTLAEAVTSPGDGYPIDAGDGKYCYSAPIELYDIHDGHLIKTINPTIIVSGNNKKIITAIPTSEKVTSNCRSAI